MLEKLEVVQMAKDMAAHAAARQAVVAANVANADTPGYKAADLQSFAKVYVASEGANDMHRSRPQHLPAFDGAPNARLIPDLSAEPSPNGNTVSLETELVRSGSAKRQHEVSLAVYRSALDFLRTSLGRGR